MDDQRFGAAVRTLRLRRNWRQCDLARAAGVSRPTISRIELGHVESLSVGTVRAVAAVLDVRLDLVSRWRGGDLDRLLSARHSAMHEAVARMFAGLPGWTSVAEVSFAVYGERGVVDVLAWHAATRTLLVIELKTELVDVQEVLGTLDRKRRLATTIGRERGWVPAQTGAWLLLAESTMNRNHVRAHGAVLRSALPGTGLEVRRWLARPAGPIRALSFLAPTPRPHEPRPYGSRHEPGDGPRPHGPDVDDHGPGHDAPAQVMRNAHARNPVPAFAARKRVRLARPTSGDRRTQG